MRIVHTADWHVGRVWKNLSRLDEMKAVLEHLARFVTSEKIDLLLMAGDVFDAWSPGWEAERLVFWFFKTIGQAGVQSVVIAGNHDHPGRLDAWGQLAEFVGVHTVGRPRSAKDGGVRELRTHVGETAVIAALPFAPVRTWVSALEMVGDETRARQQYAHMFERAIAALTARFRPDAVNLIMAHTHLDGAVFGDSERRVHLGDDWAAAPQVFPGSFHYVALGHIHKQQKIEAAPAPAYYCGSPLQLDFGEAGQDKSFLVIEAKAGKPVRIDKIPYEGGRPLQKLVLSLQEIEARQESLRCAGWLHMTVPLVKLDPDLGRRVRELVPNALVVHAELPQQQADPLPRLAKEAAPLDHYRVFHRRKHQEPPATEVEAAFQELYEQVAGERDAPHPAAS